MVSLVVDILKMIEQTYHKKYIGKLRLKKLNPFGYQVSFGLNNNEKPITIAAQIQDQQVFVKHLQQELRVSRFNEVSYFTTHRYLEYQSNYRYEINISQDSNGEIIVRPESKPESESILHVDPGEVILPVEGFPAAVVRIKASVKWEIS